MSSAPAPLAPAPKIREFPAWAAPLLWVVGGLSALWTLVHAIGLTKNRLELDIAVYVLGGRNLMNGHLYHVTLPHAPHLPFTYPPFAALVFAPLSLVQENTAEIIWATVNVVFLFALIALSLHAARPSMGRLQLVPWALLLMAPAYVMEPVRLTLSFGQVNIVLAAFVVADLTVVLRLGGRTLPRGVLLGIAASVKLVPLIFVPYLFVTRQTRAAWVSLGTFVGCSALAALVSPSTSWSFWTRYVVDAKRIGDAYYTSNQSLRAVIDRLDHQVVPNSVTTLAGVVVAVAGIALAAWAYRVSSPFLGVLVCATTGLLASPITWAHHLVWVVPVLIWLVLAPDRPRFGPVWAVLGAGLFYWAPIWALPYGGVYELHEHGWVLVKGNAFFAADVLFMVGVAFMLWWRGRTPHPDPVEAAPGASGRPLAGIAPE